MRSFRVTATALACASLLSAGQGAEAQANAPVLVTTTWLADHANDNGLVIIHVGSDASFITAHIPGSRPLAVAVFGPDRDGLTTQMPDVATFERTLSALGVSNDSRIILYSAPASPVLAARLYVTLDHFGLGARTSLLDGGLTTWQAEKRAIATGAAAAAAQPGRLTLTVHPNLVVTYEYVGSRLADQTVTVIDARTPPFYTGEQFNQARAGRPGRIAGALSVPFSSVTDATGRLLPRDSLVALFARTGATSESRGRS